jgi:hypothetical protein
VLVIASTLLTKRHAAVDIAAGVVFGWIVYRLIFAPVHQGAAESAAIVDDLEIRDHPAGKPGPDTEALGRFDSRRCLREFAMFVTLAAMGSSISIWAIAHSTVMALAVGAVTSAVSLNSLLLLLHEGIHRQLVPNRRWNWIITVLLGSIFLMSFSAFQIMHLRLLRFPGDRRDADRYRVDSRSRHTNWPAHFVRLMRVLLVMPVSALRFGSASQRKFICSEYALLFLVCSFLLRTFSLRALFLVWILPMLLTVIFVAVRCSIRPHERTRSTPRHSDLEPDRTRAGDC